MKALQVFERQHLNLIHIHSVHAGNYNYNFAIELNVERNRLDALRRAMRMLEHCVERHLAFGAFEVLASPLGTTLGITFKRTERDCGRVLETDVIFNPAITQFTPQTEVPYALGFHEVALHELGHVVTLGHEVVGSR